MSEESNSDGDELQILRKRLDEKCKELSETRRTISKLERQLQNANRFNDDLQNQVKLLNAKLCLHNEYVKCVKISIETQTDDCIAFNERVHNSDETRSDKNITDSQCTNDWISKSKESNTSVAELVREAAQVNCNLNDYLYDSSSKTYFSRSTGWYYYPEIEVFFDPSTKNYYKYDAASKTFKFYSSLQSDETIKKKKRTIQRRQEKPKQKYKSQSEETDSMEEEGEIESSCSSDVSVIEISDEEITKEIDYSCIRMIVKQSTTLDEGSLLLITCKGARIGNDENCEVYLTDECVSKLHAEVTFDEKESVYCIKDLNSEEGSFICDSKLVANETYTLKHGDLVRFGVCELLIHIHEGRDVTCIHCEPGCVQASLKTMRSKFDNADTTVNIVNYRKQLNAIKKKYGINTYETTISVPKSYKDRAEERRQTVGSDNPYEKTEEGASHEKPLTEKNKGYKMMKKMGWVQGHGLGKAQSGRINPFLIRRDTQKQTKKDFDWLPQCEPLPIRFTWFDDSDV